MIKMIKGTYGLVVDGAVEAMTSRSAPFSLSLSREEELIAAGVAVKVDIPAEFYETMTITELRGEAGKLGVDLGTAKRKSDIITVLKTVSGGEKNDRIQRTGAERSGGSFS